MPKPRNLRPRETSTLAVAPVTVTDRSCAVVLGLEPRTFRSWLESAGVRHTCIGRRVIARTDDVLAAIANASAPGEGTGGDEPAARDDHDVPETPDGVLARIGRRRTA